MQQGDPIFYLDVIYNEMFTNFAITGVLPLFLRDKYWCFFIEGRLIVGLDTVALRFDIFSRAVDDEPDRRSMLRLLAIIPPTMTDETAAMPAMVTGVPFPKVLLVNIIVPSPAAVPSVLPSKILP